MLNPNKNFPRLLSLDVFRGITIALMILVNSPGNQTAYACLNHSIWNGCTLADLVFPFFIFIVGVSLVFSLGKQLAEGVPLNEIIIKVAKRTFIIFLLGLFLNAFPRHFDFESLRIFGVLQRIAICYFLAALLFLTTRIRTQALIALALLICYWLIMTYIPVPGFGADILTPAGNLAAYLDRLVFSSAHLYGKVFDPEGILSTMPALATTLLGNLTGAWLCSKSNKHVKLMGMLIAGLVSCSIGWIWGYYFPINKALWTSSYVLWTGGLALLLLALCYGLIEIQNWRRWSTPFIIFGTNAIAAYFLHIFFLKIQAIIHVQRIDGSPGNLRIYITEHLFGWASLPTASLLYALSYTLFWLLILWVLYRNKIFIKI